MPSGAKKRKAAKKKMQKEAHSNGTHSQDLVENDEPKSHDERESGGGEVGKEEEDEQTEKDGEGVVDVEEDVKEASLEENAAEIAREVNLDKDSSGKEVKSDVVMPMETPNGAPSVENGISGSLSLNDNEIGAEEEQLVVEEVVSELTAQGRMLKPADYLPEEAAGAEGRASIEEVLDSIEESIPVLESVKQVVPLVEEVKHFAQSALVEVSPSYAVESKLKENGNDVLILLDDKDKESPVIADLQPEKVEAEAILVVDEVSVNSSDVVGLTGVESGYKLSDSSASQAADLVDDVKDSESPEKSVDRVSAQAVDVKDLTVHENLEGQSLISSTPPAGQRASWKNCCGLLELFMGSSR